MPALPQVVDPPGRGDHLLVDGGALAPALDDVQICAAARGLLAEIHGGKPAADSMPVRLRFSTNQAKSSQNVARHP